jgi:hypothetical protein
MCQWSPVKTLRSQLTLQLALFSSFILAAMVLSASLYAGLSTSTNAAATEDLQRQIVFNALKSGVADGVRAFDAYFELQLVSFLGYHAVIRSDQSRSDNPYQPNDYAVAHYMDSPENVLPSELTHDQRYANGSTPITLQRGSWRLKGKRPSDLPQFAPETNRSIGAHFVRDNAQAFIRKTTGVLTVYSGTLPALFVEFPGVGTTTYGYDWVPEDWAQSVLPGSSPTQVLAPYTDPYVGRPIVTVAMAFRNVTSTLVAGVAAFDIDIGRGLRDRVIRINFRNTSDVALYWVNDDDSASFVTGSVAMTGDAGAKSIASNSHTVGGAEVQLQETSSYFYASKASNWGGFVVVQRVPTSYLDRTMSPVRERNRQAAAVVGGVLAAAIVIAILVVTLAVWYSVKHATESIGPLSVAIAEVSNRYLGYSRKQNGDPILAPKPQLPEEPPVEEEAGLYHKAQEAVHAFNKGRGDVGKLAHNAYYDPSLPPAEGPPAPPDAASAASDALPNAVPPAPIVVLISPSAPAPAPVSAAVAVPPPYAFNVAAPDPNSAPPPPY